MRKRKRKRVAYGGWDVLDLRGTPEGARIAGMILGVGAEQEESELPITDVVPDPPVVSSVFPRVETPESAGDVRFPPGLLGLEEVAALRLTCGRCGLYGYAEDGGGGAELDAEGWRSLVKIRNLGGGVSGVLNLCPGCSREFDAWMLE